MFLLKVNTFHLQCVLTLFISVSLGSCWEGQCQFRPGVSPMITESSHLEFPSEVFSPILFGWQVDSLVEIPNQANLEMNLGLNISKKSEILQDLILLSSVFL